MSLFKDITGQIFGRLTVVSRAENNKNGSARWLCKCTCNNTTNVSGIMLRNGSVRSCGCLWMEKISEKQLVESRFWKFVNKYGPLPNNVSIEKHPQLNETRCWVWMGCLTDGYGRLKIDGFYKTAHHVSWFLHKNEWPEYLCHSCDNRACINPDHLFLGDNKINTLDMISKGRGNKSHGEMHFNSKLSEGDVLEIRRKYSEGNIFQYQLAEEFGTNQSTISCITRGETWKHLPSKKKDENAS